MARDKITVDLLLATKQAEREIDRINRKIKKLGKAASTSFGGATGGGDKVRALGSGLSKATVKADEFAKSMEASNARVIAFGASAGLIMGVERALKAMVASAMKVEKAMMDINIVMNASTQALEKFGKGMFKVAKETAQGFDVVAEAAVELARQGLGAEKTLQRTKDALILTRLTGMSAADAVKSLTAAVNSFNKEGVTSAQVINRMAKVDAKFAVSSDDLAKSISRVGASAVSAGVNMNELMAITTAVQQRTARGGAVIGNAFKTIFTRIQRSDVQKRLRGFGVATRDMQGNMLSGMKVLQGLADNFDKLTKSQQASISENVAGVFQVNILKAALSDLSQETSAYSGALRAANSATDEAYQKNEKLNQTLDSLVNRTLANLTSAGATLGGATLGPAIERVLNTVNATVAAFAEGGVFEKFGQGMGKDLLTGIGKFISGPGLIFATAMFGKLALSLGRFVKQAAMDIMGINTATKQRAALEEAVVAHIASEPALLKKVRLGTLNVLTVEKDILKTVKLANAERARIQAYARPLAASIYGRGARTGRSGVTFGKPGGAGGFVPNFADAGSERMAAAAGGYRAGSIRTMSQPGAGTMMYNSAETVKRFPGMTQSAIMPPERSAAGTGYRGAFGAAHGFDPYAAGGFVPNFAQKAPKKKEAFVPKGKMALAARGYTTNTPNIGVALGFQGEKGGTGGFYSQKAGEITNLKGNIDPRALGAKIILSGVKTRAIYQPGRDESDAQRLFESEMDRAIRGSLGIVAQSIIKQVDVDGKPIGGADLAQIRSDVKNKPLKLSPAFEGDLFEEGLRIAIQGAVPESNKASFDFEAGAPPSKLMKRLFGSMPGNSRIDAKRQQSTADNIVNKYFSEGLPTGRKYNNVFEMLVALDSGIREGKIIGGPMEKFLKLAYRERKVAGKGRGKAGGFVPNFSPLSSAIGREMEAGVPASAIRVGNSPALKGAGNPGGMGVYNTIHEPRGLDQGIRRSRAQGMNPITHGGALGWVPNFADPWNKDLDAAQQKEYKKQKARGRTPAEARKKALASGRGGGGLMSKGGMVGTAAYLTSDMVGGAIGGKTGEVASTTLMAAGGGLMAGEMAVAILGVTNPVGLAIAATVGLGMAAYGLYNIFKDDATPEIEKQVKAQLSLAEASRQALEGIDALASSLTAGEFVGARDKAVAKLKEADNFDRFGMVATDEFKAVEGSLNTTDLKKNIRLFEKRALGKRLNAVMGGASLMDLNTGVDMMQGGWKKPSNYVIGQRALTQQEKDEDLARRGLGLPATQRNLGGITMTSQGTAGNVIKTLEATLGKVDFLKRQAAGGGGGVAALSQIAGGEKASMEEIFSIITGFKAGDFKDQGDRLRALIPASELEEFKRNLAASFSASRDWIAAQKAITDIEDKRKSVIQEWVDANRPLIDSIIAARRALVDMEAGAKLNFAVTKQEIQARKQLLGMNQQIARARRASTTTNREMIDVQFEQAEKTTRVNKKLAFRGAAAQRRVDLKSAQGATGRKAAEDLLKNAFAEGTVAGKGAEGQRDAFLNQTRTKVATLMDEFATATPERAKEILAETDKRWGELTAMSGGVSGALEPELAAEYTAIIAVLPKMEEAINKEHQVRRLATEKAEDEGKMAEKRRKLAIIQYNNALKLFIDQRQLDRAKEATIKQAESLEAKGRYSAGRIGYGGDLAGRRAAIEAERAAGGYSVPSRKAGGEAVFVPVSAAETARKDIALTEEQIARSLDGASDNIVDATRIFTNALREAASDLVSFEDVTTAAAVRKQAEKDYEKGLTTSDTLRGRRAADRLARRRTGGARSGDVMEAFRDQFLYNDQDAMDEFEEGVIGVANTMKTSFEQAFKSIASGASSAQEAFAGMAVSILDSVSDMSAQMASNMLFNQMNSYFGAQGGLVPRYNQGGVVTGGSGHKDDVLSMMSGGEFVIKKSSAQKIGYGTLDAINSGGARGYAGGGSTGAQQKGPGMGSMMAVSAGASALSGIISQANQPDPKKPWRGEDYGFGRGKYGYFGGPEHDAGRTSSIGGGGRSAQVSLNKGFAYYRRDPQTGRLISERARPTEGRFEVSSALSLRGRLGEEDPQTSRMFGKEGAMGSYQDYLFNETKRRKDVIKAHEKMKQGRRISAWMNAAMLIGGSYMMGKTGPMTSDLTGASVSGQGRKAFNALSATQRGGMGANEWLDSGVGINDSGIPDMAGGGSAKPSPAMLMGGEYVMSPQTVRTYGSSVMQELNRGNVPGMAGGGFVGNQGVNAGMISGGEINKTNNNVNISINVDKRGTVKAQATSQESDNAKQENTLKETENNKELGKALQTVVLQELIRQQRPGGLLRQGPHTP